MKTPEDIESAICREMNQFSQEYMSHAPKAVRTHLVGDMLVVRLNGVLTAAEQQLVKKLHGGKGRELLKLVRIQLMEAARPVMESMVQNVTGVKVRSLHHDISTVTGEGIVIFILVEPPPCAALRKHK